MHELQVLHNQIERLIAKQTGKQPKVHYYQGRQLQFSNQNALLFLLPHNIDNPITLQVIDPEDPNYGKDYTLADLHPADDTNSVVP